MDGRRAEKKRYGILLAVIAAAILLVGILLKPHQADRPSAETTRSDALRQDLNNLRELAQRGTLHETSSRFASMASADAAFLLATGDGRTAVVWSGDGILLAGGARPPVGLHLSSGTTTVMAAPAAWGAGLPFTLYRAPGAASAPPSTVKMDDLDSGTWTVVDTLGPDGPEFVSGMFSGIGKTTCAGVDYDKVLLNAPFDRRFAGSGMFDIDGNLIAVLAQCDHEVAALPVDEIAEHLAYVSAPGHAEYAHLGFVVQLIARPLDALLHSPAGLAITDVWSDYPAGQAGLQPGNVILSINNAPATSVQQLTDALTRLPVQMRVQSAPHVVANLTLSGGNSPPTAELEPAVPPLTLSAVSPTLAAHPSLRAGDQILTLNGRPATQKAVAQLFAAPASADQPNVLTVQRGPRRFLVVVPE